MVNTYELRLGNLIQNTDGAAVEVIGVKESSILVSGTAQYIPANCFNEMPLTKEYLESAGFELDDDKETETWYKSNFGFISKFKNGYTLPDEDGNSSINYVIESVHLFQNIYHAKTGEDLPSITVHISDNRADICPHTKLPCATGLCTSGICSILEVMKHEGGQPFNILTQQEWLYETESPSPDNKNIVKVPLASYNHDTEVFKKQEARIKELEGALSLKEEIINKLSKEIDLAQQHLDLIGAPKYSVRDNELTLWARIEGCAYVEPKDVYVSAPETKGGD